MDLRICVCWDAMHHEDSFGQLRDPIACFPGKQLTHIDSIYAYVNIDVTETNVYKRLPMYTTH